MPQNISFRGGIISMGIISLKNDFLVIENVIIQG
jgi:hypothetical protein